MSGVESITADGVLSVDGKDIFIVVYLQPPKVSPKASWYAYLKEPELNSRTAKAVRQAVLVNGTKTRDVTARITSNNPLGSGPPFFVKLLYA